MNSALPCSCALALSLLVHVAPAQRAQIGNGRPRDLAVSAAAGNVVFSASNGVDGVEPWFAGGVAPVQLADLRPGPAGSYPIRITRFLSGGIDTFLVANDGTLGRELFAYDGTTTALVADIDTRPGRGADPAGLTRLPLAGGGAVLLFSARDATHGRELWSSDGTAGGTQLVLDLEPGAMDSSPTDFAVIGNLAVFNAETTGSGAELWVTDGTAGGTLLLVDIWPGAQSATPRGFVAAFDGFVYFAATSPTEGRELWRTDGTAPGTIRVTDLNPGAADANPEQLTVGFGGVAFVADDGANDRQLWVRDPLGALLRHSTFAGGQGSTIVELAAVAGDFWFGADDGITGQELWTTTAGGAMQVIDLNPGPAGSRPKYLTPCPSGVVVRADDGVVGEELFHVSSPPAAFATLLADIRSSRPGLSSCPSRLVPFSSAGPWLFSAENDSDGIELWITSCIPGSTTRISDIDPDPPLPELQISATATSLDLLVVDAPANRPLSLFIGVAATSPIVLPPLRGAILLDPALLLAVPLGNTDATGALSVTIPGPPLTGGPVGFQALTLNDAGTRFEATEIATWSTGSGSVDAGGATFTAEGHFDDDNGEYKITVERTDNTTAKSHVAVIVVDDEGERLLQDEAVVDAGKTREFEGNIEDLLSPTDVDDAPATSIEVRVYAEPPKPGKLGGGTVIWESYC